MAINVQNPGSPLPGYHHGTAGADHYVGNSSSDLFMLSVNDDVLDTIDGGRGTDTLSYQYADRAVRVTMGDPGETGHTEADFLVFRFFNPQTGRVHERFETQTVTEFTSIENVTGSNFGDTIIGNSGANKLEGLGGFDQIRAGAGNDVIIGGRGRDTLFGDDDTGPRGADTFVFTSFTDSSTAPVLSSQLIPGTNNGFDPTVGLDAIMDFEVGIDKIDLSAIDANATQAGDQAFKFLGVFPDENASNKFTGQAGELYAIEFDSPEQQVPTAFTIIYGDIDGDRQVDFSMDVYTPFSIESISANDFLL